MQRVPYITGYPCGGVSPRNGTMSAERPKIVICAEYQGEGAVAGSTTGFQRSIEEWIHQAGKENACPSEKLSNKKR